MESLKFFIFAAFLFFGILAQRFQRHLNITNDAQNETLIDRLNFLAIPNELVSDELSGVQEGNNVRLNGYGGIPIELNNGELKFEFCSDGCMDKIVVVCYDAQNVISSVKGECESNQCVFQAGVSEDMGKSILWFMSTPMAKTFTSNICETAVLKSSKVIPSFVTSSSYDSCQLSKSNGNVVKLFVRALPSGCRLKVKNAKIWSPTTPSATTPSESATPEDSSKIGSTVWIILGILLFILVIGFIAFGIYCFCTKKQKKPATIFDEKPKEILAENKTILESQKIEENVENGKSEEPKEAGKAKNKTTEEKQETVEEKLVKKDVPKKQKKVEKPKQKTIKIKIEDIKKKVEPTLDEATTEVSIVQQPKVPEHYPSARVSKELILPVPKSHVKKMKPKNRGSTKTDSLSGRHEVGMLGLVESPSESLKRHCNATGSDDLIDAKLESYYKPGVVRVLQRIEIAVFCCKISSMMKQLDVLIDMAEEALAERDVKFDEDGNILHITQKAEQYLERKSTPEFIRSYAFGQIYRTVLDSHVGIFNTLSIPLLFVIVLQKRYTVLNRRKACAWMRRQLPIVEKEFTPKERSKLSYPINAIDEACKMDPEGFKNTSALNTNSGIEEDETQASTHASEKKKESRVGKKKQSKKQHSKK